MNWKNYALLLGILLLFVSCEDPVVKVNGKKIYQSELDTIVAVRVQQYEAQGYQLGEEDKASIEEELLTGLVDQTLLNQKAKKLKIDLDKDAVEEQYQSFLGQFETEDEAMAFLEEQGYSEKLLRSDISVDLLVQNLLEQEIYPLAEPEDSEVESFYNENPSYFVNPESVHASHILIKVASDTFPDGSTKEEALDRMTLIMKQLDEGADFAELAKSVSEGPSNVNGGDLGWFGPGDMVPEFDQVVFSMEPGEISGVVETMFGLHLIKLQEKKDASVSSLDEMRENIANFLRQENLPKIYDDYIASLRADAKIDYFNTDTEDREPSEETEEVTEG